MVRSILCFSALFFSVKMIEPTTKHFYSQIHTHPGPYVKVWLNKSKGSPKERKKKRKFIKCNAIILPVFHHSICVANIFYNGLSVWRRKLCTPKKETAKREKTKVFQFKNFALNSTNAKKRSRRSRSRRS